MHSYNLIAILSLYILWCSANNIEYNFASQSKSQLKEDILIHNHFFYGKRNGVVIESGALDGIKYSTTYAFHKILNWSSIHIEGDSENYYKLLQNRPDAINIHAVLCSSKKDVHFLSHKSGGAVSGIREFMSTSFLKWRYSNASDYMERVVTCVPLSELMAEHGINHANLWVLDVEGGELDVLRGIDFSMFSVDVILIETVSSESRFALSYLQSQRRYRCAVLPAHQFHIRNHVCVRSDFVPSSMKGIDVNDYLSRGVMTPLSRPNSPTYTTSPLKRSNQLSGGRKNGIVPITPQKLSYKSGNTMTTPIVHKSIKKFTDKSGSGV
mmetsp:Transcript_20936/g.30178  ORF Transcript_20936/g.30178 Transcript_20936/m.30178 type:complete len:325 (+) Transcript_20936:127-1101(+)